MATTIPTDTTITPTKKLVRSKPGPFAALAVAVAFAAGACLGAQTVPVAPIIVSPMPQPTAIPSDMAADLAVPAAPDNYVIGDRDLLSVFVYQMPSLTRQVRVNSSGAILLPMLPHPITAAGLTTPELERSIGHELVVTRLASHPVVQVVVRQVESHPIVVSGEVRYPGVVQAARPMSLLEVLSRAGWLNQDSGTQVLLTQSRGNDPLTQALDVHDILAHPASPQWNPTLDGGESVRVLPARMIYAVGSFKKPGAFPLHSDEPITVLKAIALAEGIQNPAKRNDALLFRAADGDTKPIPVNISKILEHKAPDLTLEAGDILYVPESGWGKLVGATSSVAVQAASIAIGYRFVH